MIIILSILLLVQGSFSIIEDPYSRFESLRGCDTNIPIPPNLPTMHREIRTKFLKLFTNSVSVASVVFLEGVREEDRHSTDIVRQPFRQESNFLYLTGANEPNFNFALQTDSGKSVLIVPKRDEYYALWNGVVETPEEIKEKYGVDEVFYNEDIEKVMNYLSNNKTLTIYMLDNAEFKGMESFKLDRKVLKKVITNSRIIKTEKEIELLRVAFEVSNHAHIKLMKDCQPNLYEFNLESFFIYYSMSCGCKFQAYLPIVGSGNRSAILHYSANSKKIEDGAFVLVDAGAEYKGYASDVTRTYPSNGKFSSEQKLIYEMVLRIQDKIESQVKPGVLFSSLAEEAYRLVCKELLSSGFLQGDLDDMINKKVCGLFYPHGLGHFLGIDVHDATITPVALEENTAITIEPGIYFNRAFIQSGLKNPSQSPFLVSSKINKFLDMNIGGVRIEDDLIVTVNGAEVLTKVPKTIKEIEELMSH